MATRRELLLDPSPLFRAAWKWLTRDRPADYDDGSRDPVGGWIIEPKALPAGWPPMYRLAWVWQRVQIATITWAAFVLAAAGTGVGPLHAGAITTVLILTSVSTTSPDRLVWKRMPRPARVTLSSVAVAREVALITLIAAPLILWDFVGHPALFAVIATVLACAAILPGPP